MASIDEVTKNNARLFLERLETELNAGLPSPEIMRENIQQIITEAKSEDSKKYLRGAEYAFLNFYAIPIISRVMQTVDQMDAAKAKRALLCEFWNNDGMKQYCEVTGQRSVRSPFLKRYLEAT